MTDLTAGPFKVTIFGAGSVGKALAAMLSRHPGFAVQLVDCSEEALDQARALGLDIDLRLSQRAEDSPAILSGQHACVAAVPEYVVPQIARAAASAGVHYLDLSKTRPETRLALENLAGDRAVFLGCGASPGIVENFAAGLVQEFSTVTDLVIRVGAIPRFPTNRLGYGLIWNIDGLIDEYTLPSSAIRDGQPVSLASLEGYECFTLDGVAYEGFITSGGVDEIAGFLKPSPRNLTFKTIRHPGHLEYIRFLLDDLGLRGRRDMLRSLLCNGLPLIEDDVVLFFVTARGYHGRQLTERSVLHRFAPGRTGEHDNRVNALTLLSAGHAASLLLMLREGEVTDRGFMAHQAIPAAKLLASPFLKAFV